MIYVYDIVETAKKLILWVSNLGNPGDSMMSFSFLTNESPLIGCKTPSHPLQLGFIRGLLEGYKGVIHTFLLCQSDIHGTR